MLDFYLLHALDRAKFEKVKALGIVPYLEEMRAAGKIRYLGFSSMMIMKYLRRF